MRGGGRGEVELEGRVHVELAPTETDDLCTCRAMVMTSVQQVRKSCNRNMSNILIMLEE